MSSGVSNTTPNPFHTNPRRNAPCGSGPVHSYTASPLLTEAAFPFRSSPSTASARPSSPFLSSAASPFRFSPVHHSPAQCCQPTPILFSVGIDELLLLLALDLSVDCLVHLRELCELRVLRAPRFQLTEGAL